MVTIDTVKAALKSWRIMIHLARARICQRFRVRVTSCRSLIRTNLSSNWIAVIPTITLSMAITRGARSAPGNADTKPSSALAGVEDVYLRWSQETNVDWHYIAPGKPTQNAFV